MNMANDNQKRLRKNVHLKSFDYKDPHSVYFLTICTANKQRLFFDDRIANIIVDQLKFRRRANEIRLFCYCIMPDHLHLLLSLGESYGKTLPNWISAFKRNSARSINEIVSIKELWQRNFYDHVIRKDESLLKIGEYILNNPVRKGIVMEWKEYPYSRIVDEFPV